MQRRTFLRMGAALAAMSSVGGVRAAVAEEGVRVRFLGTGAADWNGRDKRGELRRFTSLLCDNRILFDFTRDSFDLLPNGVRPEILFYTHSHRDHYSPEAARRLGVRKVFLQEGWMPIAKADFEAAKSETPMPELIPLRIGTAVQMGDLRITPLPANHATEYLQERTLIYLIEKGATRLLYATDTAGIPSWAHRLLGAKPLTAIIMEDTIGLGHEDDPRIFDHSSVGMILHTLRGLAAEKKYAPPEGQPVYLTHLARTLHGTQAELDDKMPAPLRAAFDGFEAVMR
jgi:phosphoribosyl 1,2-cyclic phosphodiesterase